MRMTRWSVKQRNKLIKFLFTYCRENIGINPYKKVKTSYRVVKGGKTWFGECTNGQIIVININMANTPELFTQTFIHEYVHSIQPILTNYNKLYKKFGYDNHPYEIEANSYEYLYKDALDKFNKTL